MIRSAHLAAALVLLAAAPAGAFAPPGEAADPRAEDAPPPVVSDVTPSGYHVRVPVGRPVVRSDDLFGFRLSEIAIPGGAADAPAGSPQLPVRVVALRVPWGVEPRVRATLGATRPLGALRPVPLPYLLSLASVRDRTSAPEVARWLSAAPYLEAGAPWSPLLSSRADAAGSERLLVVSLAPVHWDPRSGFAEAADAIDLDVSWEGTVAPAPEPRARPNALAPRSAVGPRYAPALRPPRAGAAGAPALGAAPAAAPLRVSPALPWVRLGVTRPGLYALSPADLAAAGVATAGIDPSTFRVFRARPGDLAESVDVDLGPDGLHECAIAVSGEGDGNFDPGDRIYLYATGSSGFGADLALGGGPEYEESQRSGEESLWLTWGPGPYAGPPRRMTLRGAPGIATAETLTTVTHRVHYEENRFYQPGLFQPGVRWERWLYAFMAQGTRSRYLLTLPGALPGGAGSLRARAWGFGISIGAIVFDHYLNVSWDRVLVASAGWNQTTPQDVAASGFAVGARDTIDFDVPVVRDPTDPGRYDQSYLAWFEVSYPRRLRAAGDTLQFVAPDSLAVPGLVTYVIGGVTDSASVWLLDRTDPESPVRVVGTWSGGPGDFTLSVPDSAGPGSRLRYTLVSTARAPRPPTVQRYAPVTGTYVLADLLDPSDAADYLIVVPEAFLPQAQSLASYRAAGIMGLPAPRVAIATMERVAAQFGAGLPDATAIRNLLTYARRHWTGPGPGTAAPPTYVCLLGDATQDPRNYLGFGERDWVPTYENYFDPDLRLQFISDDWIGFLDGPADQLLDVAIGRLPAHSTSEAQALVSGKLQAYEGTTDLDPWRARSLLAADDSWKRSQPDPIGNGHVEQMERKDRRHLPYPLERSKVYLNDYAWADTTHQSKPAARQDFIARMNEGNWLVDFIGHGSENVLADEQLFRLSDVGSLTNAGRPSIFGVFSCTVGKFDELGSEGLGELTLKTPNGGSVASLAATEAVFPNESTSLNDSFVEEVFPLRPRVDSLATLGLAWARAKNANVNRIVRKYVLLGDPALRPPVPPGWGVWEKAPLDSVLRGQVATISGHALNSSDSTLDATASGTALLQVQGPPIRRRQAGLSSIGTPDTTTYLVPGAVIFRGTVPLSQGRFTATFTVPTDGRIVGPEAQLRALLSSAGGRGTGLAVDSLIIAPGAAPRVDVTPPQISLRYPSGADSSVQAGSRLGIVLEDSSGINLMRIDNAHTIFVVLDELGAPIELTPGFQYDPGSHTRGSADFVLPSLPQGPHLLEVHASDNYGNIGVRSFVLDVRAPFAAGDPLLLTQVFNYPNPFRRDTFVHARLNQPARLTVRLLTVAGRRVREMTLDGRAGENYVPWDGLDSVGEKVAIGVYLIQVVAEAPGGKRATAVGRALRQQ